MRLVFRPADDPALLPGEEDAGEFAAAIVSVVDTPQIPPWCSYLAFDDGRAVGFGGFKSKPHGNHQVEIGYLTFASCEGQGIASAFAAWLVETARAANARSVYAHTLPEFNASTRVLEKAGFTRDGWGRDEDVGEVWRWRVSL